MKRDALMIALGAAVGSLSTWALTNAVAPSAEAARASAPRDQVRPTLSEPAVASLESQLHQERVARAQAEARAVQAQTELEISKASPAPPSAAPAAVAPAPAAKTGLDPAQVAARLKEIEASIDSFVRAKDGKKLLALYSELSKYGREAWPLAAKLGAVFEKVSEDGGADLGLNGMDFYKGFVGADFAGLYADAILHPDSYDKEFRKVALWGLSMSDTSDPQVAAALVQELRSEKDVSSLQMIVGLIAQNPPPGATDAIVDAITNQKNKQSRQVLVWSLTQLQGDDATRAITALSAAETDPGTKQQLDLALKVRAAPVAGYFVAYVQPQSDAEQAGIKPGDVITTLQGQPVKNWQQLQGATGQTEDEKPLALVVYRDGQTFNVQLSGGKSFLETGVSGDFAKGQAR